MKPSEIDVSDPGLSTDNLDRTADAKAKKPRAAPIAGNESARHFLGQEQFAMSARWRGLRRFIRKAGGAVAKRNTTGCRRAICCRAGPSRFSRGRCWLSGWFQLRQLTGTRARSRPAPISKAHAVTQFSMIPAIATTPNSGSCTNCHSLTGNMEQRCAACHHTEAFTATVIKPHEAAGIGCVDCHAEHQGAEFSATAGALASCTQCHNDSNQKVYNGRKVGTPHGGTFGYPVVNGEWSAKSINDEEWELRKLGTSRLPTDSDQKWRSNQFHALHDQRVKIAPGMKGNAEGRLSCSSCHNSFDPLDRATPRTTCAACHVSEMVNRTALHVTSSTSSMRAAGVRQCFRQDYKIFHGCTGFIL